MSPSRCKSGGGLRKKGGDEKMVVCYACGKRFNSNAEFYKHAKEVHGGIENAIYKVVEKPMSFEDFKRISGFVEAEYENGIAKLKILRGVADYNYYIDVWDCKGKLHLGWKEEEGGWVDIGYFLIPKRIYREEVREDIEKICFQVLEDRGGAINQSGKYYLDDEHIGKILLASGICGFEKVKK